MSSGGKAPESTEFLHYSSDRASLA